MTYSSIDDVKVIRLGLNQADTSLDGEIPHFIEQADSMIDEVHRRLGIQVPVQSPSERLRRLSADVAAVLYVIWNSRDPSLRDSLRREIREMLMEYQRDLAEGGEARGVSLTGGWAD